MNRSFSIIILSSFLCALAGCNSSPEQDTPNSPPPIAAPGVIPAAVHLHYLEKTSIPVGTWLRSPFAMGSIQEDEDLNTLLDLQSVRTQVECDRAKTEVGATFSSFYGPAYGPLSDQEVSVLSKFFKKIGDDAGYAAGTEKLFWKRSRPFLVDTQIHPCVTLPESYSYPSTHSTLAHTYAQVLDLIFPSRQPEIDARAEQIAEDRVIGGVHYTSDIAAGKLMSGRVFTAIQNSDTFQTDLQDAQAAVKQP